MSEDRRRTIKGWGGRLCVEDELLTIPEAHLLAAIATADRAMETLTTLRDIQARLTRMEIFLARVFPDYDEYARTAIYKAIVAADADSPNGRRTT